MDINNCKMCSSNKIIFEQHLLNQQKSEIKCCNCGFKIGGFQTNNTLISKWNEELIKKYTNVIHIRLNSIGNGEDLCNFELFDKVLIIDEQLFNKAMGCKCTKEFIDEILFDRCWDDDFYNSNSFEELDMFEWSYLDNEIDECIIARYKYINTLCEIKVFKCDLEYLNKHKQVYYNSKSFYTR